MAAYPPCDKPFGMIFFQGTAKGPLPEFRRGAVEGIHVGKRLAGAVVPDVPDLNRCEQATIQTVRSVL
jgi:hypothetical protein